MARYSTRPQRPASEPSEELIIVREQIWRYINQERVKDLAFYINTMRLEIFPHQLQQDLPACFTFKNNDGLDFHMRIRRTPSSTTLEDADENPLEGLQTRFGNRWHPLSKWIEGRYRKQTLNETSANQGVNNHVLMSHLKELRSSRPGSPAIISPDRSLAAAIRDGSFFGLAAVDTDDVKTKMRLRRGPCSIPNSGWRPPLPSDLEVGIPGHWMSFENWLSEKLSSLERSLSEQQKHRSTDSDTFRLLDLPYEIRALIYEHITGSYIWPRLADGGQGLEIFGQSIWQQSKGYQYMCNPGGHRPPNLSNIQYVSKQVRTEFRKIAVTSTTPHFLHYSTLVDVVPFLHGNWLRRISLGFPNYFCFHFLGFNVPHPRIQDLSQTPIQILRQIPTLTHLDLHFQVSRPARKQHGNIIHYTSHDPWNLSAHNTKNEICCQKVLLDWFFTIALETLRGIRFVSMSGHVKHSTRAKWEAIFDDERNGIVHDMSAAKQEILSDYLLRPLPPACLCKRTCHWWKEFGPHPEGEDPNIMLMWPSNPDYLECYDRARDQFVCED